MAFNEELQERIARYETELRTLDNRVEHLQSLIAHVKALLEEETRDAQFTLPGTLIQTGTPIQNGVLVQPSPEVGQGVSVPDVILGAIPAGTLVRFNVIRDTVRDRLWPDRDIVYAGKLVASALSRAIGKGTVERVGRGLYRRPVRKEVATLPIR